MSPELVLRSLVRSPRYRSASPPSAIGGSSEGGGRVGSGATDAVGVGLAAATPRRGPGATEPGGGGGAKSDSRYRKPAPAATTPARMPAIRARRPRSWNRPRFDGPPDSSQTMPARMVAQMRGVPR